MSARWAASPADSSPPRQAKQMLIQADIEYQFLIWLFVFIALVPFPRWRIKSKVSQSIKICWFVALCWKQVNFLPLGFLLTMQMLSFLLLAATNIQFCSNFHSLNSAFYFSKKIAKYGFLNLQNCFQYNISNLPEKGICPDGQLLEC